VLYQLSYTHRKNNVTLPSPARLASGFRGRTAPKLASGPTRPATNFTRRFGFVTIWPMRGARTLSRPVQLALLWLGLATPLAGCLEYLPEQVPLVAGASNVEVVSDPPNADVYEAVGEVSAQVVGKEVGEALRQAANDLRNQAAKRGATFVSIDDVTSRAAWDFSGRLIVSMSGTAYKPK
jgi:hypothetical protein